MQRGTGYPRSSRDWEEFATALLEDGLTLTALELYTELLESGKDLQCLKDYFSNPGNFEHIMPQGPSLLHSIGKQKHFYFATSSTKTSPFYSTDLQSLNF